MTPTEIQKVLKGRTSSFKDEVRLHEEMEQAFIAAGYQFEREVPVAGGRIDFLFADGTGVEVKVRNSGNQVSRQVIRYLSDPRVTSMVIVSAKAMTLPLREHVGTDGVVKPIGLVELWRNSL